MDRQELVDAVIRELERKLQEEELHVPGQKSILVLGSLTAQEEQALSGCGLIRTKERPCDMVLAASMSCETMAQAALGIPQNREASWLLESLLEGIPVYVLAKGMQYRAYRESAGKTLYRMYQEYEEKISQYGAEIINDIGEIRERTRLPDEGAKAGCLNLTGIRVLTEAHLNKARSGTSGAVLVDRKAVITPLARDYIASHRLNLIRQ